MLSATYYPVVWQKGAVWEIRLAPDPAFVQQWAAKHGLGRVWAWDRPFPLWLGEKLQEKLDEILQGNPGKSPGEKRRQRHATGKDPVVLERLGKALSGTARRYGVKGEGAWVELTEGALAFAPQVAAASEGLDFGLRLRPHIHKLLPGRALTVAELQRVLERAGVKTTGYQLSVTLQELILAGKVERVAAVGLDRWNRFYCRRCGERERIFVEQPAFSPYPCRVCSSCRELGVLTDGTPLYRWRGGEPQTKPAGELPPLVLPALTVWQERAVAEALAFWRRPDTRTLLVWAVCGAGKTEVVFPVIREALAAGKRVILAVPRREIVRELGERVKSCFPGLPFSLLYGGHKEEAPGSGLVVATTHQLLRFTSFFDLAIVDEADAFPLYGNPMLNAVLERVLLPTGKKIYMTATPDASWRLRAQQGKISVTKIPLRYHGHPLPVPHLIRAALPGKEGEFIPQVVKEFIFSLEEKDRKGLLFMPTVAMVEAFTRQLKRELPDYASRLDLIHARDPRRDEKVKGFASGKLWLLVTTTLLERGLNFDRLDLMILYADEERIFSPETLIQIAGRVGRQAADPGGDVYFVADRISRTMRAARDRIRRMNEEGAKARCGK